MKRILLSLLLTSCSLFASQAGVSLKVEDLKMVEAFRVRQEAYEQTLAEENRRQATYLQKIQDWNKKNWVVQKEQQSKK